MGTPPFRGYWTMIQLIHADRPRICRKYAGSIGCIGLLALQKKRELEKIKIFSPIGQYVNRLGLVTRVKPIS